MSLIQHAFLHPRRVWLRRAFFQIHLWAGLLLALYLFVISLSGAVLVFRQELTRPTLPGNLRHPLPIQGASPEQVMRRFEAAEPGGSLALLQMPSPQLPAFLLEGKDSTGQPGRWWADAVTGAPAAAPPTWVDTLLDLHAYLLLPHVWGMQANALGAAGLLALCVTGLVIWWPGSRAWTRGLRVHLRGSWRRVNYDLHSAIGFWTLPLVAWWAFSGIYFGYYRQVTAAVAAVSPLRGMRSPAAPTPQHKGPERTTLSAVIGSAQGASRQGKLWSVSDPSLKGAECYVLMDLRAPGDFSHRDIVRVSTADAHVVSVWHYGERHSLGDWVLWSMHPLHFGTTFGVAVKIFWALLGASLALLTVTGALMYWNRYLRRRWEALSRG